MQTNRSFELATISATFVLDDHLITWPIFILIEFKEVLVLLQKLHLIIYAWHILSSQLSYTYKIPGCNLTYQNFKQVEIEEILLFFSNKKISDEQPASSL